MSTIQYAGQFEIEVCDLITSSGEIADLTKSLIEVNIFEDIYSSALKGSVIIADTNNMIRNLQILGQDYIRLKVRTPGFEDDKCFDFSENVFAVYKIGTRAEPTSRSEIFELSFVSVEALTNVRKRISKSLTGSPSEIFEQLMKGDYSINTKKKLYIEKSSGIRKYVVPNNNPFKFIESLMQEAVSSNTQSPFYLFFENVRGYHFRTLQSLYNEETKQDFNTGELGELEDRGSKVGDIEKQYRTVIADEQTGTNDMFKNIVSGLIANKLRTLDIHNKRIETKDHNYFDNFNKFNHINGDINKDNPIYSDAPIEEDGSRISDYPNSKVYLHPYQVDDTTGGDPLHYNKTTESYSYTPPTNKESIQFMMGKMIELATAGSMNLKVNGHTGLACGDTITYTKPDAHAKENGFIDELDSGKFLITAARHIFSKIDQRHQIVMTCNRDSHPYSKRKDSSIVIPRSVPQGKFIVE